MGNGIRGSHISVGTQSQAHTIIRRRRGLGKVFPFESGSSATLAS